jgi:hypothetical protein
LRLLHSRLFKVFSSTAAQDKDNSRGLRVVFRNGIQMDIGRCTRFTIPGRLGKIASAPHQLITSMEGRWNYEVCFVGLVETSWRPHAASSSAIHPPIQAGLSLININHYGFPLGTATRVSRWAQTHCVCSSAALPVLQPAGQEQLFEYGFPLICFVYLSWSIVTLLGFVIFASYTGLC